MTATENLLRRLAANDKASLQALLASRPSSTRAGPAAASALDRETWALVQLAALLASDAGTISVRWAVERASSTGADDATVVRVLLAAGAMAGSAQMVASASRLARAIDLDLELDDLGLAGWDET